MSYWWKYGANPSLHRWPRNPESPNPRNPTIAGISKVATDSHFPFTEFKDFWNYKTKTGWKAPKKLRSLKTSQCNGTKLKFALLPDKKILLMKLYRTTYWKHSKCKKAKVCCWYIFMVLCHWFDDFVLMVQLWFCCGSVSLIWCPLDIIESSKWPLGLGTTSHCK